MNVDVDTGGWCRHRMAPRCLPDQLISVDTRSARRWRRRPARRGRTWINDTRGWRRYSLRGGRRVGGPAKCAHRRRAGHARDPSASYGTTTRGVVDAVISQVTAAGRRAGVAREKVLIDPHTILGKNTFHGYCDTWPILLHRVAQRL